MAAAAHTPVLTHLGRNCSDTPDQSWSAGGHPRSSPTPAPSGLPPQSIADIILIKTALDFSPCAEKPGATYWQELQFTIVDSNCFIDHVH